MKIFVLFSLIVLLSCKKNSDEISTSSRAQLKSIKDPQFFHDSLGLGELFGENKISYIKRYFYGADNYYYFDYYTGTKKLKSIFYKPAAHPLSCASALCEFFYKNDRIDKIEISLPSSACEIIVRSFQFDYFPIGALKSIIQVDDYGITEIYFAYDSSGRINKIFRSGRYKTETFYRFSETIFNYDITGNVKDVTFQPSYSNTIYERFSFSYDTVINPFKGIYIPDYFLTVFGREESSALFLSPNVVNLTTQVYESNSSSQSYPYIVNTNSGRLHQFYYFDQFGSTIYYQ